MERITASLVLEILGRPIEHVSESLNGIVEKMGAEEGIKILDKTLHDPIPLENSKELFTSFAEISLELDSLDHYINLLFAYMPSNIEIISPEKLTMDKSHLNEAGNKLVQRLHDYDAITKNTLTEKNIILKKLQEVAPHLFKQPQQETPKTTKPKNKPKKKNKKN